MPIYMKLDDIPGEVTAKGYEKWIELQSYSWGVSNTPSDTGGGTGKAKFDQFSVSLEVFSGIPKALYFCASGKIVKTATVVVVDNEGREFSRYLLNGILIGMLQANNGSGEGRGNMYMAFNFQRITWYETVFAGDGSVKGQNYAWWSIVEGRGGLNH